MRHCRTLPLVLVLVSFVSGQTSCVLSTTLTSGPGSIEDRTIQGSGGYTAPIECHWKVSTPTTGTIVQLSFTFLNLYQFEGSSNDVLLVNLGSQPTASLPQGWQPYTRSMSPYTGRDAVGAYNYAQSSFINLCPADNSIAFDPTTTELTKHTQLTDAARTNTWIMAVGELNPLTLVSNAQDVYIIFRSFIKYGTLPAKLAIYGFQLDYSFVSAYCKQNVDVVPLVEASDAASTVPVAIVQDNMLGQTIAELDCTWNFQPTRMALSFEDTDAFDSLWLTFTEFDLPGTSSLTIFDEMTTLAVYSRANPPASTLKTPYGFVSMRYVTDATLPPASSSIGFTMQLQASYCPRGCTGSQGTCLFGQCVCIQGWSGPACNVPQGWRCPGVHFNSNDGCDCGCGLFDPDCNDTFAPSISQCTNSAISLVYNGTQGRLALGDCVYCPLPTSLSARQTLSLASSFTDAIELSCPSNFQCPSGTECTNTGKCAQVSPIVTHTASSTPVSWRQLCNSNFDCPGATTCTTNGECQAPSNYGLSTISASGVCSMFGWPNTNVAGVTVEFRIQVTTPRSIDTVLRYPGLTITQTSQLVFSASTLPLWSTSVNIADGQWHDLVWVWDNVLGTMMLYSGSTLLASTSVAAVAPSMALNQQFTVGRFDGGLAFLRLWSVPRAPATFFQAHLPTDRPNIVAEYRFADGSARDHSYHGNDLSNSAAFASFLPSSYACLASPLNVSAGLSVGSLLSVSGTTSGPWVVEMTSALQIAVLRVAATPSIVDISVDGTIVASLVVSTTQSHFLLFRFEQISITTAQICIDDLTCGTVTLSATPATAFAVSSIGFVSYCLTRANSQMTLANIISTPTVTTDRQPCQFPFSVPMRDCTAFTAYLAANNYSSSTLLPVAQAYAYAHLDLATQACTCSDMPTWSSSSLITRVQSTTPPQVTMLVTYTTIKTTNTFSIETSAPCAEQCYLLEPGSSGFPMNLGWFIELTLISSSNVVLGATATLHNVTREFTFERAQNGTWQVVGTSAAGVSSSTRCLVIGPDAPVVQTTFSAFGCQTAGASILDPPVVQPYCVINSTKKTCLSDVDSCGLSNGQVTLSALAGSFDDGYTVSITNGIHFCAFKVSPSVPAPLRPYAMLYYAIEKTQLGSSDILTVSSNGTALSTVVGTTTAVQAVASPVALAKGLTFTMTTAGDKSGTAGDGFVVAYDTKYVFSAAPTTHFCSTSETTLALDDAIIYPTYNMSIGNVVFPTQAQCDYLIRATDPASVVWLQFLDFALTTDRVELYDILPDSAPVLLANLSSSTYGTSHFAALFNGQSDYIVSTLAVVVPATITFYINVAANLTTDCSVTNACVNGISKPMKVLGTDNRFAGFNVELNVATGFLSVNFNAGMTYTLTKDLRLDTWSHIAFVRRQRDVFGYVNATRVVLTTSGSNIANLTAAENLLYIGGQANLPDSQNIHFAGQLYLIMLFDMAKTVYDIGRQEDSTCNLSDPSLLLCYAFSTSYATADASRFHNDCKFHGASFSKAKMRSTVTYKTFAAATSQLLVRYIPFYRFSTDTFRFLATAIKCPTPCFGQCQRGQCVCNPGAMGLFCNVTQPNPCSGHVILPSASSGMLLLPWATTEPPQTQFVPDIGIAAHLPLDCSWHFRNPGDVVVLDIQKTALDIAESISIYEGDRVIPMYVYRYNLTAQLAMDRAAFYNRGRITYSKGLFQNVTPYAATATLWLKTTQATGCNQTVHIVQYRRGQRCVDATTFGLSRDLAIQLIQTYWNLQSSNAYASAITPIQLYFNTFDATTANVTVEYTQTMLSGAVLTPYTTVFHFIKRASQPYLTCKTGTDVGLDHLTLGQSFVLYQQRDLTSSTFKVQNSLASPIFNFAGTWTSDSSKAFSGIYRVPFVLNQLANPPSFTLVVSAKVVLTGNVQYIFAQEENANGSMLLKLVPTSRGVGLWVFGSYGINDGAQSANPVSNALDTVNLAITFSSGVITYFVNGVRYSSFDTVQAYRTCSSGNCTPAITGFSDTSHGILIGGRLVAGQSADLWGGTISSVQLFNSVLGDAVIASLVVNGTALTTIVKYTAINGMSFATQATLSTIEVATVAVTTNVVVTSRLLRVWTVARCGCDIPPLTYHLDIGSLSVLLNSSIQSFVWNAFDDTSALVSWFSPTSLSSPFYQTALARTKSYGYTLTSDFLMRSLADYGSNFENIPYYITRLFVNAISPTSATVSFTFLNSLMMPVDATAMFVATNNTWQGPLSVDRLVPPNFGTLPPTRCRQNSMVQLTASAGILTNGEPTQWTVESQGTTCGWSLQAPDGQSITITFDYFYISCTEGTLTIVDNVALATMPLCGNLAGQSYSYGASLMVSFAMAGATLLSTGFYAKYSFSGHSSTINTFTVPVTYSPWRVVNTNTAGSTQCQLDPTNISASNTWQVVSVTPATSFNSTCYATNSNPPDSTWVVSSYDDSAGSVTCATWQFDETMPWTAYDIQTTGPTELNTAVPTLVTQPLAALTLTSSSEWTSFFKSNTSTVEVRYISLHSRSSHVRLKYYQPHVYFVAPPSYRSVDGYMGDGSRDNPFTNTFAYLIASVLQAGDMLQLFPGRYEGMGYCNLILSQSIIFESISGNKLTTIDCQGTTRGWQLKHTTGLSLIKGLAFINCMVNAAPMTGASLFITGNTIVDSCTFENNLHKAQGTVAIVAPSVCTVIACAFSSNTGRSTLAILSGTSVVHNCTFTNNLNTDNGALHVSTYVEADTSCANPGAANVSNTLFSANSGAPALTITFASVVRVAESFFEANDGGGIVNDGSHLVLATTSFKHHPSTTITATAGATVRSSFCSFLNNGARQGSVVAMTSSVWVGQANMYQGNVASINGGGAVFGTLSNFSETDSQFIGNRAISFPGASGAPGGAVVLSHSYSVVFQNTTFQGNSASGAGGAVMLTNATTSMSHNRFVNNNADGQGGAVRLSQCLFGTTWMQVASGILQSSYLRFHANTFTFNTALRGGGAVSMDSTRAITFDNDTFEGNRVLIGDGGAVEITSSTNVVFISIRVNGCSATRGGAFSAINSVGLYILDTHCTVCQSNTNGGSILSDATILTMTNLTIDQSMSGQYGGGMALQGRTSIIVLINVSIANSLAVKGGGLYIVDCEIPQGSINRLHFKNVTASAVGGGIYTVLTTLWLNQLIAINSSAENGGFMSLEDSMVVLINSSVQQAKASVNGGAIYAIVSTLLTNSTQLVENNAANYGGSIYGFASNFRLVNSTVQSSMANLGGGIYASSSNIQLETSVVKLNRAGTGGGICSDLTSIVVDGCTFQWNSASGAGGAASVSYNFIQLRDSIISNNDAKQGGAFMFTNAHGFSIETCFFTNNTAHIDPLNRAVQQGGALAVAQISENSSISNSVFQFNNAEGANGGAVYATMAGIPSVFEIQLQNTTFKGNQAGAGGALYLDSMLFNFDGAIFQSNEASTGGGGGVFWEGMEPLNLQSAATYQANQAVYGLDFASSAYALIPHYTSPGFGEDSTRTFQGLLTVRIVDQYNQTVITENSAIVSLGTATLGAAMTGVFQVPAIDGVCNFTQAGVQQTPGLQVTISASSPPLRPLQSVVIQVRSCVRGEVVPVGISQCVKCAYGKFSWNTSDPTCHDCPIGAVCGGGDAIHATEGYWRFPNTTGICGVSQYDSCKLIHCEGPSCGGCVQGSEQATVEPQGPNGTTILMLPNSSDYQVNDILYVLGATVQVVSVTSNHLLVTTSSQLATVGSVDIFRCQPEACAKGYTGNLCLRCDAGYTRSGKSECVPCPTSFGLTIFVLVLGAIAIVIVVVVLIILAINKAKKGTSVTSIITKIFTSYMQLIVLAESFNVNWPEEVTMMFNTQGLVASPGNKLISIECFLDYYNFKSTVGQPNAMSNYYSQLIVFLLLPVLGILAPLAFWTVRFRRLRSHHDKQDWAMAAQLDNDHLVAIKELPTVFEKLRLHPSDFVLLDVRAQMEAGPVPIAVVKGAFVNAIYGEIRAKLILSIVVIMFLIHPSMSNQFFQMFSCTQLGTDADGKALYYLHPDLDVPCYTPLHNRWMYFVGVPGLVLITLGVPLFAFSMLFVRRHDLDNLKTKIEFGFLYTGFKRKHYYWELWVTQRKIIVSFISVFFKRTGVGPQVLASTILVFFALYIHMECRPYENDTLNDLEQRALLASLFTHFSGLFLYQAEIVGTWRGVFGVFVIVVNSLFALQFLRLMAKELRQNAVSVLHKIVDHSAVRKIHQNSNSFKDCASVAPRTSHLLPNDIVKAGD
ncbi:Aste57867_17781 [Aphanomyces stellatus]|uniref:Aste57867_17781 protein n=1 Tax=Aphanomyces stellatus TaxID=120398 RepID=A0A485L8M4_9STRA|nr:hypothetical protein As57867_017720 [Aphanomyces stellatus]VFT94525.1 Aste57867_17781 [Aphanomyces stellatus]